MDEWFTFDKVKALIALCTFLAGTASYFGYDGLLQKEENQAVQEQMTTVINHYYDKDCKK